MCVDARRRGGALLAVLALLAGCGPGEPVHDGKKLSEWIEQLGSPDTMKRMRAAHAVGEIGPPARKAVPLLARLLEDRSHLVRWAAASSLGRIGADSAEALPRLEKLSADDPDESVRDASGKAAQRVRAIAERAGPGG